MNIRKNIDYGQMYAAIDDVVAQQLPQMQLYYSIGKIVCARSEKGAAVMASEYIIANYPDAKGFSPRSLRRMRDFYRTYENHPALLSRAMQLGWIHNVVIMEADLTMELREWYLRAVKRFSWSKMELIQNINYEAHREKVLDIRQFLCKNTKETETKSYDSISRSKYTYGTKVVGRFSFQGIRKMFLILRCRGKPVEEIGHMSSLLCKIYSTILITRAIILYKGEDVLLINTAECLIMIE